MDFSFDSVSKFLQQVQGAKAKQREAISEHLDPLLDDPSTYMVPPAMAYAIDALLETYGDEALKQVGMVAIGKWVSVHQELLDEHLANDSQAEALLTMSDLSKLITALRILSDIGSFGGDDDYRKAMGKEINQAVLEKLEEVGRNPDDFFNGENHDFGELP